MIWKRERNTDIVTKMLRLGRSYSAEQTVITASYFENFLLEHASFRIKMKVFPPVTDKDKN